MEERRKEERESRSSGRNEEGDGAAKAEVRGNRVRLIMTEQKMRRNTERMKFKSGQCEQ